MSELRQNIESRRSDIQSVKLVPKRKRTTRMADSVTAEQHNQAFNVIAKALSRNTKYVSEILSNPIPILKTMTCMGLGYALCHMIFLFHGRARNPSQSILNALFWAWLQMQKKISTVHRCFFCIACVILVILAASVATVTVLILQYSSEVRGRDC